MVSAGKYYLLARAAAAARAHSMEHTHTHSSHTPWVQTWRPGVSFFIFIPGPRAIRRPANGTDCVVYCLFGSLPSVRIRPSTHNMCRLFMRAPTARFRTFGAWEIENHFSLVKSAWGLLLKRVPHSQPFKRFANNGHHMHLIFFYLCAQRSGNFLFGLTLVFLCPVFFAAHSRSPSHESVFRGNREIN
jgi:hypothetical protein